MSRRAPSPLAGRASCAGAVKGPGGGGAAVGVVSRPMLRISWPLAFVLAGVIAIVARKPQLLRYVVVVFAVWLLVELVRNRTRR